MLGCRFKEKRQKIELQISPGCIYHCFLRGQNRQKKNRVNEDLWYILCVFIEEEDCFEMEIYQSALFY